MELKFAEDQVFCTTLCYVAFTDIENMIGDAAPARSLTRNMEPPFQLRVAAFVTSQGNRTTVYLPPSWTSVEFGLVSLVSTSEPDLTVELSFCTIDVTSKCGLSLAARGTVAS